MNQVSNPKTNIPKIKVLHVLSRVYPYAGTERKVIQLLNKIDRNRFIPSMVSMTDFWEKRSDYLSQDIICFALNKKEGIHFTLVFKLAKIFRKNNISIVHSHNWPTLFHTVLAAKMARVPVIIHGEHGRDTKELDRSWKRTLIKKKLFQLVNKMVVVAEDLKQILKNEYGVNESKIEFIPNGVDIDRFEVSRFPDNVQEKYNIRPSTKVIATIAKLRPVKDIPTLIKAFRIIYNKVNDSKLIIAGSTDGGHEKWLQEVKNLIRSYNLEHTVLFPGNIANIPEFLSVVDVYVNSSVSEGMSNTILEAMTARVPVVASRVGGNVELVRNGETGYLFKVEDEHDCADKVLKILQDPFLRKKMGENARRIIEEQYDIKSMVKHNEDIYLKLYREKFRLS